MTDAGGVLVHLTSADPDDWRLALRNLANLRTAPTPTAPDALAVVVHGAALPAVLDGSPVADVVAEQVAAGVSVRACENTLAGREETADDLLEGVSVVPSGVAEVVHLQRDGWAYLKLP